MGTEILFCDLCNESVPEGDLETGRAYRQKGRLVCADCDQAMGGGGPREGDDPTSRDPGATPAPPGVGAPWGPGAPSAERVPGRAQAPAPALPGRTLSGAGGVVVGLVTLVFATAGFYLLIERLDLLEGGIEDSRRDLEGDLRAAERTHELFVAGLPGQFALSESRVNDAQEAARGELRTVLDGLRLDLGRSAEREQEMVRTLREMEDELVKQDRSSQQRIDALKQTIVSLEKDVRFYSDRVIELEETLRTLSARAPLALGGAPGGDGGVPSPATRKAWEGLLADLKHTNAGIRLDAIYALGETGDSDVVPHLIPMLEDVDLFVRMATARMLEDLDARSAVPALIDALEDRQSAVREAAMVALRQITGKDFRFEPVASDAERAKRVKLWRDWWKKNGSSFLAR